MDEPDKVKLELDLPKDQVSVHPADDSLEELLKKEAVELRKTKKELQKVKKERNELKKQGATPPGSVREAVAKELDPTVEGPVKEVTGYELGEIITAPLHPPEGEVKARPVRGQVHNLFVGFALMPLALIALLIFGWQVGIAVALVGAAFIAMGVLVRV
ncbi:MAG TPA: hypothetical protein VG964_02785 [Candidatus Saccharimonadales bacterium]|nr:hypothetical protein [Candidatus Saccharimonadales bacterium]